MRILIISFYYAPDLSAGSFRATSFIKTLKEHVTNNDIIEVITTIPNRYLSYKIDAKEIERIDNIVIRRIRVPFHQSGFYDQSKSFLTYFLKTLTYIRNKKYDIVFATSSRLFSAFLGAIIARYKRIPLYLDIRDIFTETMSSILGNSLLNYFINFFKLIEKFTIKSAKKINFVSEGFVSYFKEIYGDNLLYSFYPNGIDDEFMNFEYNSYIKKEKSEIVTMTYTGNIGEGQGLEKIVPLIAKRFSNIIFQIIGDGGRKNALTDATKELKNVKLLNPVNRNALIQYYKNTDFLFLHLNNYDAFKRVLPSKIFEYAATYKPIIAGVDGYPREFLEKYIPDSIIFDPCDVEDFSRKYNFTKGYVDFEKRKLFIQKFSRRMIMNDMVKDFLDTITSNK